jgi:hypothetical protein
MNFFMGNSYRRVISSIRHGEIIAPKRNPRYVSMIGQEF